MQQLTFSFHEESIINKYYFQNYFEAIILHNFYENNFKQDSKEEDFINICKELYNNEYSFMEILNGISWNKNNKYIMVFVRSNGIQVINNTNKIYAEIDTLQRFIECINDCMLKELL